MSAIKNDTTQSDLVQTERESNEVRISLSNTSKVSIIDFQAKEKELLGVIYGIGMNINNVIGSGIVTSPGIIWKAVKSPEIVLLLWFVGGIVSMSGSLSYVELGVIHKISGGETKYLQTAYPDPKFMMSYLFSFMFIFAIRPGIISAVLQSAAQYFWYTIKGYRYDDDIKQITNGWHLPFSPFWFIKLIAVGFLFIITIYHMLSNRWANYINQTLAIIKLTTYSIIAIAGIYRLIANWSVSRINWQTQINGNSDIKDYSTSILLIMFSYDGWNSLNYSLDEFRKVEKKLIYSNSISVGIVTIIYLLVNVAFISVVPASSMDSKSDETIAATFFRQLFGESEVIVRIFTALVVLSVIGTAASTVWSGSRVIVAAAISHFFPIYSYELRTWHNYFNTPVNALFAQFIWCTLIIFFVGSSFTLTSFTLFSTFSMYSYWIFYFATGVGLLIIRNRNKNNLKNKRFSFEEEEKSKFNGNSYNLLKIEEKLYKVPLPVATIFILAGLFILTFSFVVDDRCPEALNLDPPSCNEYSRKERIQQLSPMFISYGFFIIAIIFWYFLYYWWNTYLIEKNSRSSENTKVVEKESGIEGYEEAAINKKLNEEVAKNEIDISDFSPGPSNRSISQLSLNRHQSLRNQSQHSLTSLNRKNQNQSTQT
ncbi:amino acid permease-domain-containing protein [Glomus cerebriforme]|uniref:Amino acid permease-domain-containing protein n=1 Tax=Glomus cerebriforme TaxID=658196 RepID=A0A397T258_9GLOM|nr:amino acid permease-domain-containing protein [Glomus cerebriforme]